MLKLMVSVRLGEMKNWLVGRNRSKKGSAGRMMALYALLMVYAFGMMCFFLYTTIFSVIGPAFFALDLGWLYFAIFIMIDFGLMFIGSVFMTKSELFEAKDNELLLSLPIPPRSILAGRMVSLLIVNYLLDLVSVIAAVIAWLNVSRPQAGSVAAFVITVLALPFLALAVSSLFGWIISLLTRRVRRKSIVSTVISLIFLIAYMIGIQRLNGAMLSLADKAQSAAEGLKAVTPLYWMGTAIANADVKNLILSLLFMLIPFAAAYMILSATFSKTTSFRPGAAKLKYKGVIDKGRPVRRALFIRELRRIYTSSAYMLNAALGAIFMVIGAAVLLIKTDAVRDLIGQLDEFQVFVQPVIIVIIGAMNGMVTVSAPSVSMEGKSIWITRSVPVDTKDILLMKLAAHMVIAGPATLLISIASAIVFQARGVMLLLMIAVPLIFSVFSGLVGLIANIKHPGLDWINETQALKNNISVLIAIALTWLAAAVMGVALIFIPAQAAIAAGAAVLIAICAVLWRRLMTVGIKRYEKLG